MAAYALSLSFGFAHGTCESYSSDSIFREDISPVEEQPARSFYSGFNLEVAGFQQAHLKHGQYLVDPLVIDFLKGVSGASYRYPGGTVSNYLDLSETYDRNRNTRRSEKFVSWLDAAPVKFGVDDYRSFIKAVGGYEWYVLNIYGTYEGKQSAQVLADSAERVVAGVMSAGKVLRWEIGNELYLPKYSVSGTEYAQRSIPMISMLRKVAPGIRPVIGLATFDIGKESATKFNNELLDGLNDSSLEYAVHYYYDGPPGGPPVRSQINNLCRIVRMLKSRGELAPVIWVTEHAKWPPGKVSDPNWKLRWQESNTLGAALSVADFTLAVTQIPEVRGAFVHSLGGGKGAWVMFHRSNVGNFLYPSVVMEAIRLLHIGIDDVVLMTTQSLNQSLRASFFRQSNATIGLLAVHKGKIDSELKIRLPAFAGQRVRTRIKVLSGASEEDLNTDKDPEKIVVGESEKTVEFDRDGRASFRVRGLSLSRFDFEQIVQ